jgi:RNA polymerase sigma factor (sigma-70 family)
MPAAHLERVLNQASRAATLGGVSALTDAQLLDRFLTARDETAFEVLVRRHGPMVLGVCRRITGNHEDAEDAFQAVFLVLSRKAASVTPRDAVGNWLYGVACRTALKARGKMARRRSREKQVEKMPERTIEPETDGHALQQVLDLELSRLPDKYRAAVVLCELQGRSRREAARMLKLPEGTLSSRLAKARKLLAERLTRRGLVLSAAALAAALSASSTQAAIPSGLLVSTVKAASLDAAGLSGFASAKALALTEGVLTEMFLSKLKTIAALVVALIILGAGTATFWPGMPAVSASAALAAPLPAPVPEKKDDKKDDKKDEKKDTAREGVTFTAVVVDGPARVTLRQADKEDVQVGNPMLGQQRVEKGVLYLNGPSEFTVDMKELARLEIKSIAFVQVKDVKAKTLAVTVEGAARLKISGSADEQTIHVKGAGNFDGEALKGKSGNVTVVESGRAVVHVTDKLSATVAAVGQIEYLGSPKVEEHVSDIGSIKPRQEKTPGPQEPKKDDKK